MKQAITPLRMLNDTELSLISGGFGFPPPPEPIVPIKPGHGAVFPQPIVPPVVPVG